jgi:hypothetical protein
MGPILIAFFGNYHGARHLRDDETDLLFCMYGKLRQLANVVNRRPSTIQCAYDLEVANFQDVEISLTRRAMSKHRLQFFETILVAAWVGAGPGRKAFSSGYTFGDRFISNVSSY